MRNFNDIFEFDFAAFAEEDDCAKEPKDML